jgi:tetratricopeptide (TPR) repeat protein
LATAGLYVWQQQPAQQSGPPAGPTPTSGAKPSVVREANEAYELAQVALRDGKVLRAQELIRRALTLDSHFAAGRQFLATTYNVQILEGDSNDASLLYKSDEELRRAVQEDPSLPGVHADLATVAILQGDKQRGMAELEPVLVQDPFSPAARFTRLVLLQAAEENAEAKQIALELLKINPLFPPPRIVLIELLLTEGDLAGALREAFTLEELAPNAANTVGSLSNVYMGTGQLGKARQLLEEKQALLGKNYRWRMAWALLLASENKNEEALRAMDSETLKWAGNAPFQETLRAAEFFALLGDIPNAIDWLDRAVRRGDERVGWFQKNPRLASIREDPNFQRIVNSVQARRKQQRDK